MRLIHYLFCFLLAHIGITVSTEYTYPVASFDNGTIILYIHQTSQQSIELCEWNTLTDTIQTILWSLFNPGGLTVLPNNQGFSFIDNGRLRIKQFCKRSPKTIDFDEPIFNIQGIQWIDEHTCYCSAQYGNHFSLFELHDDGTLNFLIQEQGKDCMYPQKIDNHLFYIARSTIDSHYFIVQTKYDQSTNCSQVIVDFGNLPIMFLNMISAEEGFVLGYKKNLEYTDTTASFFYYHLIKKGDDWYNYRIFSFEIPRSLLLDGNQRLFESILPLLPRIIDHSIYYVDCSDQPHNYLEPYCYDLLSGKSKKLIVHANQNQGHLFVPMKCGNKLYFGGNKQGQKPLICFLT